MEVNGMNLPSIPKAQQLSAQPPRSSTRWRRIQQKRSRPLPARRKPNWLREINIAAIGSLPYSMARRTEADQPNGCGMARRRRPLAVPRSLVLPAAKSDSVRNRRSPGDREFQAADFDDLGGYDQIGPVLR
jgi:hypothetical protein